MAQLKVNGAVADGQFLTADLAYFVIDEVDGSANISNYGYTAGAKDPGEKLIHLIQTVGHPVIIENANARVTYVAIEAAPGVLAANIEAAIRTDSAFPNLTVTSGTFTVV